MKPQAVAGRRVSEDGPLKGIVELAAVQPPKLEVSAAPEVAQSGVRFLDMHNALRPYECTRPRCSAQSVLIFIMAFSACMTTLS